MKPSLVVSLTAALALAAPAAASAQATLSSSPDKPCFGSGDRVTFRGGGFTPGGIVDFTRDGELVTAEPPIKALADGTVNAGLTVFNERGVEQRTYAATDRANPALTASVPLTVSALDVKMRPRSGAPSRPRRISAMGFTTGQTLWAHIVYKGSVRNLKIGALKGACRKLTATKRLFGANPPFGRHLIHFDTSRRFRRRDPGQRVSFSFRIFRMSGAGAGRVSAAVRR
jgi:hypothetical protein